MAIIPNYIRRLNDHDLNEVVSSMPQECLDQIEQYSRFSVETVVFMIKDRYPMYADIAKIITTAYKEQKGRRINAISDNDDSTSLLLESSVGR